MIGNRKETSNRQGVFEKYFGKSYPKNKFYKIDTKYGGVIWGSWLKLSFGTQGLAYKFKLNQSRNKTFYKYIYFSNSVHCKQLHSEQVEDFYPRPQIPQYEWNFALSSQRTASEARRYPIFVALERGLNASR